MNPLYHKAQFLLSALQLKDAPPDQGYEIAFAGRSNAGKSSAINTITHQKTLARTSKTPGRTQMLNFFKLDDDRRLVDLPGYGYAKVSDSTQKHWAKALENYLRQRESLRGVVLLMDIRHPLTQFDRQMIDWCQHVNLPLHITMTKADKLSRGAAKSTLHKVQNILTEEAPNAAISLQLFSSLSRTGIEEAHAVLDLWFELNTDAQPAISNNPQL